MSALRHFGISANRLVGRCRNVDAAPTSRNAEMPKCRHAIRGAMTATITTTSIGQDVSHALARLTEQVRAGVVQVRNGQGGGAGTVVRADGLIVTNHHVVRGEK